MTIDREVCICFHVSHRKLTNFARLNKPQFPSQMSECFGAGTGCGWCRPILKKIFEQSQSKSSENTTSVSEPGKVDWDNDWNSLTDEEYFRLRAQYIRERKDAEKSVEEQENPLPENKSNSDFQS